MVSEIFIVNLPLCPMYFSAKIRGFVFSLCIFMNGIVYKLLSHRRPGILFLKKEELFFMNVCRK